MTSPWSYAGSGCSPEELHLLRSLTAVETLTPGSSATLTFDVTEDDTAPALGSGDVPVLATPRLLAWCEAASCAAVAAQLADGRTSVGTRVQLEHLQSTPVGGRLGVTATLRHVDGRLLRFDVTASDRHDRLVCTSEVTRVVVDRERFAARVPEP
jgi:fluoroacetyl-CoA thioesterase